MYTIVPYRTHREISRPMMNDLFNDRFFRSFFDMNDMMGSAGFRVDIRETDSDYQLQAELPGVSQDQIELKVDNDVLSISADLNTESKEEKDRYIYSERRSGHMERSFNLEGINQDGITAAYKDGILSVTLPKAQPEPAKSARRIAIA